MTKRGKKARTKWRRLISEHARSGQTVTAFCREHGLCNLKSKVPDIWIYVKSLLSGHTP